MLNYECVRYGAGPNDWRLVPPRAIATRDSVPLLRTNLAQVDPAVRPALEQCLSEANALLKASNAARSSRTRDDVLEGNDPAKRISRGTVWTAESVQPIRDSLVDGIAALEAHKNFVLGVPLEAEEIGEVIDLAKTWVASAEDALARAANDAEQATHGVPGTEPSDLVATVFAPGTQAAELARYRKPGDSPPMKGVNPTQDGRAMTRIRNYLPGSNRGISTADYAENLKKGREAQSVTAPVKVTTAADYSRNLAAGRATKGD
jgi:hypothetical protein